MTHLINNITILSLFPNTLSISISYKLDKSNNLK